MTLGRPIQPLQLSQEERKTLERWVRRPTSAQALSLRARVSLSCAKGKTNTKVAQQMQLSKRHGGSVAQPLCGAASG